MKRLPHLALLLLAVAAAAAAQDTLLPAQFAGWRKSVPSQKSTSPAAADPTRAAVLREFGFTDVESATYNHENRRLEVRAARFGDATGAYGAFTFYQQPQMQVETIGEQALSNGNRVLFYQGHVLVDVTLDRVTAMSAAELRQLAEALPKPPPNSARIPSLPSYLPRERLESSSSRYVLGPAGLAAIAAPLPAEVVDFSRNPEVAMGTYRTRSGTATLLLVAYPTPQIAAERLRAVAAFRPPGVGAEGSSAELAFMAKRTGPIVVVVGGEVTPDEAQALLGQVNYDADVTWNERVYNPRDNIGNLIVGVFILIGVLLLFTLVIGVFFGGLRVLAKRLFPDRVFDRTKDVEIIQLHLRD